MYNFIMPTSVPLNILLVLGEVPFFIKPYVCCELQQSEQGSVVTFFTSEENRWFKKSGTHDLNRNLMKIRLQLASLHTPSCCMALF